MNDQETEIIANAHDRLHKGQVEAAHELLHKALGVDNEAPDELVPLQDKRTFDHAFRTASKKNGMRAAYIYFEEMPDKRMRIGTGGEAGACRVLEQLLQQAKKNQTGDSPIQQVTPK